MYSVIVPTHNRESILCEMLDSFKNLENLSGINFELIIIANACIDNTVSKAFEILEKTSISFKIVEEEIAGLSVARNRGIAESSGDIIVYLDDDIQLDKNWLIGLNNSFLKSDFDIIGGKIDLWWRGCSEPSWFTIYERRLLGFNDHGDEICAALPSMIFGGNFAFKKSVLGKTSGFDKKFGRVENSKGAGEEGDFVTRAASNHFKIGYSPFFSVQHLVSPERIKYSALKEFSIGAGRARALIKNRSILERIYFLIKVPFRLFKVLRETNLNHARLLLWSRLAESGIFR